jgi:manganese/iron transport system permease protein
MMIIAVFVSLIAMFIGIYSSFWIDSAPAPTIILVLTIIFILAFTLKKNKQKKNIITQH